MTPNTDSSAPHPVTAQKLQDIRKRTKLADRLGTVLALVLGGVVAYAFNTEGLSDVAKGWLFSAGLVLTVLLFGVCLVVWAGLMTVSVAGLDAPNLLWLKAAEDRIPEVARFMEEVRLQDRSLLHCEYSALLEHYHDEVYAMSMGAT